jgi:hypothetical protein
MIESTPTVKSAEDIWSDAINKTEAKSTESNNKTKLTDALIAGAKAGAIAAIATFFATLEAGPVIAFGAALGVGAVAALIVTFVKYFKPSDDDKKAHNPVFDDLRNKQTMAEINRGADELMVRSDIMDQIELEAYRKAEPKVKEAFLKFNGHNALQIRSELALITLGVSEEHKDELFGPYEDILPELIPNGLLG